MFTESESGASDSSLTRLPSGLILHIPGQGEKARNLISNFEFLIFNDELNSSQGMKPSWRVSL